MVWIATVLGPVAWLLAVVLGGYRQHCILCERKYHGINTPPVWRKSAFRYTTWVIVIVFTLVSSAVFAEMASRTVPPLVALLVFGASIALQFTGSTILAALYEKRVGIRGYPDLAEQKREREQDANLERLTAQLREASDEKARWKLLRQFKWEIDNRDPSHGLRWTTEELDRHIAFMEGRPLLTAESPDSCFKPPEEYLKVKERNDKILQETAATMFSSEEHKKILSLLKEVRASRNE